MIMSDRKRKVTSKMAGNRSNAKGEIKSDKNPFRRAAAQHERPLLKDQPTLGLVLDSVLSRGAALLLGCTRDGGTVSITVLDGDERHRTYCASEVDLRAALDALGEMYEA